MKLLIPQDKANHAIYGALVSLAAQGALVLALRFTQLDAHGIRPRDFGLGVGVVFAAGKEASDYAQNRIAIRAGKRPPHGVEFADFMATVAGAVAIHAAGDFA